MDKPKLLIILVSIILIFTILNFLTTMNLYIKINKMSQRFVSRQFPTGQLPSPSKPQPAARVSVSTENDAIKGQTNAPVTILEFSDYQCPFSARFYSQVLPEIEKNYVKTGKARFVYRDYPLPFHQNAQKAAEASECAAEQGKFWEYHDTLFENQKDLETASLKKYAKNLGLDTAKFDSCLDSGKMASEVKKDTEDAAKYGVSGTPCFFVNGWRVSGAMPYNSFEEMIEKELKKK